MFGDSPAEIQWGGGWNRDYGVECDELEAEDEGMWSIERTWTESATKDLKPLQRPDLIEQVLNKFDYIGDFNKHKKELPDVPAEDLEKIEELLNDDVNMVLGKSSLVRKW
ncbi:hypothetical protein JB92DRAFT_3135468 [Gautieria morchelliformis]|nr:hypothetical protein JB92DRAFT_3135468 [Gautieria morchelliformis]